LCAVLPWTCVGHYSGAVSHFEISCDILFCQQVPRQQIELHRPNQHIVMSWQKPWLVGQPWLGFPAAGAVTTGREKAPAWELEDQEERDRCGDGPRPKRTGRTRARTSGSPPGAQVGQCDGRRLLREMVVDVRPQVQVPCPRALRARGNRGGCVARLMRALTLTGRVGLQERRAGGAACMGKLKRYWSWPSSASVQRCWQRGVVARASFPELATRQTLARRALSARGAQRFFCRCELLTIIGECNASLLGHRPRSCALCWHSVGAAGECSPEISRLVHTEGKG